MTEPIYQLLTKLKSKPFTKTQYDLVKEAAKYEGRTAVNLWRFKSEIRILFKMGKFQSYLMLFLGVTVLPFTLYQKYQEDNQKLTKIIIFAPFGFAACMGPFLLYRRFSRKLIEAISYNFSEKKIILTKFKDGKEIQADMKDLKITRSEKGRIQELLWARHEEGQKSFPVEKTKKYQIEGLGEWQSSEMLTYLIESSSQESL